ncbi:ElyC/SanA/YdcF family protein [Pseudoalteromonas sp. OOF1S-7]|uniref:YdcF family protein n=1 Tax=Pseudoalteromonas sp. OOF1S-7 TaxID=2917757 RepID=UPI001EF656EE|nr:ElyC/SanA/YdcF family protein [Pseudoalteromonas sp. OOF1S-7]MCG7537712.1 YdcF family protein [Pseudoalteromonas sp. OOF1S-7]
MFEIKKVIGSLLMPLPLTLLLLALALLFIAKTNRTSYMLSWLFTLCLWAVSTPFVADKLISPAEAKLRPFAIKKHQEVDYIVVLGCGLSPNARLTANMQLSGCALSRLTEGLRLSRQYPRAYLIVSGAGYNKTTSSKLMADTAIALGTPANKIIQNPKARDTADEALLLATKLVDSKVALVTSASHMARAQDLFAAQGIDTIAAPVQFYSFTNSPEYRRFIASADVLKAVTTYAHEVLGQQWIALRRMIDPQAL